jgi:DNA-binding cell septation regulator SpoVG
VKINVKLIEHSRKQHSLADAVVELSDAEGDSILVTDLRVLENKHGEIWVAMPSRAISDGGKSYRYVSLVESNVQLRRKITEIVLAEFENWRKQRHAVEVRS